MGKEKERFTEIALDQRWVYKSPEEVAHSTYSNFHDIIGFLGQKTTLFHLQHAIILIHYQKVL